MFAQDASLGGAAGDTFGHCHRGMAERRQACSKAAASAPKRTSVSAEEASSGELPATPWGTAPRWRLAERLRRLSGVPLSTRRGTGLRKAAGSGSPLQTPIYHAATLPPRMLRDMASGLQGLRLSGDGCGWRQSRDFYRGAKHNRCHVR